MILADIVERAENREIKGIDKKAQRSAAIHNNFNRALEVLRSRKNLNPRYLFSTDELIKGNPEVVWGLLDDIYTVRNMAFISYY